MSLMEQWFSSYQSKLMPKPQPFGVACMAWINRMIGMFGLLWKQPISRTQLTSCSKNSCCIGHLFCENVACDHFLCKGTMNQTKRGKSSISPFIPRNAPPSKSTLAWNFCKLVFIRLTICDVQIYYVYLRDKNMIHAYIHIDEHKHLAWQRVYSRKHETC